MLYTLLLKTNATELLIYEHLLGMHANKGTDFEVHFLALLGACFDLFLPQFPQRV